ncbi:DUF7503 family protein [Halosolutus gelatinilyticus]
MIGVLFTIVMILSKTGAVAAKNSSGVSGP